MLIYTIKELPAVVARVYETGQGRGGGRSGVERCAQSAWAAAWLSLHSTDNSSAVNDTPNRVKNSVHSVESLNASSSAMNATATLDRLYLRNATTHSVKS
jgi:hypothetical protein